VLGEMHADCLHFFQRRVIQRGQDSPLFPQSLMEAGRWRPASRHRLVGTPVVSLVPFCITTTQLMSRY
jgi:hypothetical protein